MLVRSVQRTGVGTQMTKTWEELAEDLKVHPERYTDEERNEIELQVLFSEGFRSVNARYDEKRA